MQGYRNDINMPHRIAAAAAVSTYRICQVVPMFTLYLILGSAPSRSAQSFCTHGLLVSRADKHTQRPPRYITTSVAIARILCYARNTGQY